MCVHEALKPLEERQDSGMAGRQKTLNVRLHKAWFDGMAMELITTNRMLLKMKGDTNQKGRWRNRSKAGLSWQTRAHGHLGSRVVPKAECLHVHTVCRGPHLVPRGLWPLLPQTPHALSCQNQHSFCSPSLEYSLLIWSPTYSRIFSKCVLCVWP